jgi:AcrR family transcriptional regulator
MPKLVKHDSVAPPAARRRGRPRSDEARRSILRAARELLEENGPAGVTIEGIAARAGVGRPTIYRWWPDRHAVAMAALMESEPVGPGPRKASAPLDSLQRQLRHVVAVFGTPVGRTVAAMIASADMDSELAKSFRNHFILARRAEGRELLREAIARGDVRPDANVEIALDMIYGALFFRLLMGHARLDDSLVRQILKESLRGLRA